MCQFFMPVAQLDDYRFVGQCEHATISLTWWHTTWHLQPADFQKLHELLQAGEGETGCLVLHRYETKSVLWCGDAGLVLRGERAAELRELVARAIPLIETSPARAYRKAVATRLREAGPAHGRLLN